MNNANYLKQTMNKQTIKQSAPTVTNYNKQMKQNKADHIRYESLFKIGLDVVEQNGFLSLWCDNMFKKIV